MTHQYYVQVKMNNLKKALTRDDPKKYQKSKIEISAFKKTNQWDDVQYMLQKKNEKKNYEKSIEDNYKAIIESHFNNGELNDIGKLFKDLKEKYKECNTESSISSQNSAGIFKLLKKMLKAEEGALLQKYISITIDKLESYLKEKNLKEKEKCIGEFNKLMQNLKPLKPGKEEKQEPINKLIHSTSATNLKIRVTKQEYQFQEEPQLRKKKSLDFKNKSKANSSNHKEDGVNKLQQFLKESNMKLVKTKIQYDYSAIFQASKSNIQSRNKTTVHQLKTEKQVFSKATKGKKDQAFVFYRPTSKKM